MRRTPSRVSVESYIEVLDPLQIRDKLDGVSPGTSCTLEPRCFLRPRVRREGIKPCRRDGCEHGTYLRPEPSLLPRIGNTDPPMKWCCKPCTMYCTTLAGLALGPRGTDRGGRPKSGAPQRSYGQVANRFGRRAVPTRQRCLPDDSRYGILLARTLEEVHRTIHSATPNQVRKGVVPLSSNCNTGLSQARVDCAPRAPQWRLHFLGVDGRHRHERTYIVHAGSLEKDKYHAMHLYLQIVRVRRDQTRDQLARQL